MTAVRAVQLFFQEGTSDKVYNAEIVADGGAYSVLVEWGRRGASLARGKKALRVSLPEAEKVLARLVREKTNKGYQEITAAVQPAAVAPPEGQGSGSRAQTRRPRVGAVAQLLQPIEEEELEPFLADERWVAQQKLDGVRVLCRVAGGEVVPTNRGGQRTAVDAATTAGLLYLPEDTVVDGEVVAHEGGALYWLFDVLRFGGRDTTRLGYGERQRLLAEEIEPGLTGAVRVLPLAAGAKAKRRLHDRLRAAAAEGIVFKDRRAPYVGARAATQRKLKFVKSADVLLVANAGNAYRMAVMDGKRRLEVGKVFSGTTDEDRAEIDRRLAAGERPVAEVRYLYATDDEQLFQPVFVRLRDDKTAAGCTRAQLERTCKDPIL